MFFTESEYLSVVVLFVSMKPAFPRGNIIFVDNQIQRSMLEILWSLKLRAGKFLSFVRYLL